MLQHTNKRLCTNSALCCVAVQAKGPTAYANNAAFVADYTCGLLTTSFPNMTPTQIQAAVAGMMAIEDKRAFKHHMRDFLIQVSCGQAAEWVEVAVEALVCMYTQSYIQCNA